MPSLLLQGTSSILRSNQQSSHANQPASVQKHYLRYARKLSHILASVSYFVTNLRPYPDITKNRLLNASALTLPSPIKLLASYTIANQNSLRYVSVIVYLTSIAIPVKVIDALRFTFTFLSAYTQLSGKWCKTLVRQTLFSTGMIIRLIQMAYVSSKRYISSAFFIYGKNIQQLYLKLAENSLQLS